MLRWETEELRSESQVNVILNLMALIHVAPFSTALDESYFTAYTFLGLYYRKD